MMTPSLQGEQSPSNTPGSGDELVQSLADVGSGSSNVPTMDNLDSSGDNNVHSHSTLRVSASSDTNACLGSSSDNPAHSNSTLRVSAGDSSASDGQVSGTLEWVETETERGMWGEEADGRERGNLLGEASSELHVFGVKSEIWTYKKMEAGKLCIYVAAFLLGSPLLVFPLFG
ncbi:hypothetical protein GOBAR_DD15204 [Gossypium barbadense]|nr:hypothetical protein GOBAR_DD15204 [Gossypium barbadense]